jgi:hypothetical protein
MSKTKRMGFKLKDIQSLLAELFQGDIHAQRVYSLANATLGVMASGALAIHAIGQGLAQARGLIRKHAIKQVDRLLSNSGIEVWTYFAYWVPYVLGERKAIVVALDWTDFSADGQATIALHGVTSHGRATPLLWKTVEQATLKGRRNAYEDELLERLREVLPPDVQVTVLADRGFGDHKLLAFLLNTLGFSYVIRIRGNIAVTSAQGETRAAADWVGVKGRAKTLRAASITAAAHPVATVVCVQAKAMQEPWCLVASDPQAPARLLINYYAKRWGIEPSFRDTKDLRFGMGLSATHISQPARRDRLLLLNAFAIVLLTLLGAAGEQLGFDRGLKANTVKYRTHSLFRQGLLLYELIPNMPTIRLRPLMQKFSELVLEQAALKEVFCVV